MDNEAKTTAKEPVYDLFASPNPQEMFLRKRQDVVDEDGFIIRKQGFIPVDAANAQKALDSVKTGRKQLVFKGQPDRQGLTQVMLMPGTTGQPVGDTSVSAANSVNSEGTIAHN